MKPSLMPEAAGAGDRVAQRHGPVMLEQDQRRGRVVRDVLENVPRLLVGEDVDAVLGRRFGAGHGSRLHALFAVDAEADQRTDLAAKLDRLVLGRGCSGAATSISPSASLWTASASITRTVSLSQPFQLLDDLTVEVRLAEAEHEQLYRANSHISIPSVVDLQNSLPATSACRNSDTLEVAACPIQPRHPGAAADELRHRIGHRPDLDKHSAAGRTDDHPTSPGRRPIAVTILRDSASTDLTSSILIARCRRTIRPVRTSSHAGAPSAPGRTPVTVPTRPSAPSTRKPSHPASREPCLPLTGPRDESVARNIMPTGSTAHPHQRNTHRPRPP